MKYLWPFLWAQVSSAGSGRPRRQIGYKRDFNRDVASAVAAAVRSEATSSGLAREFTDLLDPLHMTEPSRDRT
jgi:hypothetical protein